MQALTTRPACRDSAYIRRATWPTTSNTAMSCSGTTAAFWTRLVVQNKSRTPRGVGWRSQPQGDRLSVAIYRCPCCGDFMGAYTRLRHLRPTLGAPVREQVPQPSTRTAGALTGISLEKTSAVLTTYSSSGASAPLSSTSMRQSPFSKLDVPPIQRVSSSRFIHSSYVCAWVLQV